MNAIRLAAVTLTLCVALAGCAKGENSPPGGIEQLNQAVGLPVTESLDSRSDGVTDTDGIESELLSLVNGDRRRNRLARLALDEAMRSAAKTRALEALDSLSHTRPDGSPYHTALSEAGFIYAGKRHGENLAVIRVEVGSADSAAIAEAIFTEWIASSGHVQNIRSENFTETGIGIHVSEENGVAIIGAAQMFAGP